MNSAVDNNIISWPEPMSFTVPDVSLSSKCGPEYFRCRELLVLQLDLDDKDSIAVFVPLENGMLLLSPWYNIITLTLEWQSFVVNSSDCSPTVVYKTENKVFTVCISSVNNYIAVYEIQVHWNGSLINESNVEFVGPLTRENLSSFFLSNFVLKLSNQEHKVFFAINSSIYVMDVLNPLQTKQYFELAGCDRVHSLSSVPDGPLRLAYCSDRSFYYDTSYEDWTRSQTYSRFGIPYLCPNGNYNVIFFNDTRRSLQFFSATNSNPTIIDNVDVTSGICFKIAGNTTYFVWSDPQQNTVSVFDFATHTHYPAASYECLSTDCPHILLLANQYLVYDVDYTTYVLNSETDFSLIFNVSRSGSTGLRVSDILLTIVNISITYCYYENNRSTTTTEPTIMTTSSIVNSTTVTVPHDHVIINDSNFTTSAMFTTGMYTGTIFAEVNRNNIIISTVSVIAGILIIGTLVSITVAVLVMFLCKRQTRYISI